MQCVNWGNNGADGSAKFAAMFLIGGRLKRQEQVGLTIRRARDC